jgi:hypothetical protein
MAMEMWHAKKIASDETHTRYSFSILDISSPLKVTDSQWNWILCSRKLHLN